MIDGFERQVGHVVAFEVAPSALDVVEFGGVFRQPLDGQPWPGRERGRRGLAGVDGAVVENEDDLSCRSVGTRCMGLIEFFEESDKVTAALGAAGRHSEAAGCGIERTEDGDFPGLAGCGHAQIGAALCPDMGQIGMGQRFGFVAEQKRDVARGVS